MFASSRKKVEPSGEEAEEGLELHQQGQPDRDVHKDPAVRTAPLQDLPRWPLPPQTSHSK